MSEPSPPPETLPSPPSPAAVALAQQLFYVHRAALEDSPVDDRAPPERWSPGRALAYWHDLPLVMRSEWIAYAERVGVFVPRGDA